jgi:hypothetical protein
MLFNKAVFIPQEFEMPLFKGKLNYTRHALNVSEDGYGEKITLPTHLPKDAKVVEVEVDMVKRTVKQVIRFKMSHSFDLVMPVHLDGRVTTVWLNERSDNHKTLDKSKFTSAAAYRRACNS